MRILLTGAAGGVGTMLLPMLNHDVRTLDIVPPADIIGSVTDAGVLAEACQGVDAIVHLGGQSVESTLEDVLDRNVRGTMMLLEAARQAGVGRVILASSNHAVGFAQHDATLIAGDAPARPDTLYGWSKAAIEAGGRLYHDRFGMNVICLRIGSWFPDPLALGPRGLAMWLSPSDGHRLIEAALTCPDPGFAIVWGISRNTRRWVSLTEGSAIGYDPVDDAEAYVASLPGDLPAQIGGAWCSVPLGVPMRP